MSIRKRLRAFLNLALSKLSNQKNTNITINPFYIKRVLIVRVNYRIGNIIFLTPLIRALEKKIPDAKVDVLVGAPFTIPIIKEMPNIENVYALPRELTKNPIKLFKKIKEINKNNYDLLISPVSVSVSSNIATFLIKANLKLGFYNTNTWLPLNRFAIYPKNISHEALKPLALMSVFEGEEKEYTKYLDIALSKKERDEGIKMLKEALNLKTSSKIVGIFRDARGEKKIKDSWWIEFLKELKEIDSNTIFIDILPPDEKKALLPNLPFISSSNLRDLAKIFSALDIFISADTGPMHLASASLTPVIALFNATNPSLYGPLGVDDTVIQIDNKDINLIAKQSFNHIKTII